MINNKKYVDDVGIKTFADKVKEKNTKQDESIDSLKHRSSQMEETIESIAATGGASQATAVTYNNEKSGLTAVNAQAAIDEVDSKLNDLSNSTPSIGQGVGDFDISDENGNVIGSFVDGGIKTKNFDSAKAATKEEVAEKRYENSCLLFEKVIFIGDSVTRGYTVDNGIVVTNESYFSYPTQLNKTIPSWNISNSGWSGQTIKGWLDAVKSPSHNKIFVDKELAIIELGWNGGIDGNIETDVVPYSAENPYSSSNKYKDTTCGYYCEFIENILIQNPNIFIILVCSQNFRESYINIVKSIANRYNIGIIDNLNEKIHFCDENNHEGTGVHSTALGYSLKADIMKSEIGRAIFSKRDRVNICAYVNKGLATLYGSSNIPDLNIIFTDEYGNTENVTTASSQDSGRYSYSISLHYGTWKISSEVKELSVSSIIIDKVKKLNIEAV